VELRDQPPWPTLAHTLGDVTHVSPLLRKLSSQVLKDAFARAHVPDVPEIR
jgi:hypothetical protein